MVQKRFCVEMRWKSSAEAYIINYNPLSLYGGIYLFSFSAISHLHYCLTWNFNFCSQTIYDLIRLAAAVEVPNTETMRFTMQLFSFQWFISVCKHGIPPSYNMVFQKKKSKTSKFLVDCNNFIHFYFEDRENLSKNYILNILSKKYLK